MDMKKTESEGHKSTNICPRSGTWPCRNTIPRCDPYWLSTYHGEQAWTSSMIKSRFDMSWDTTHHRCSEKDEFIEATQKSSNPLIIFRNVFARQNKLDTAWRIPSPGKNASEKQKGSRWNCSLPRTTKSLPLTTKTLPLTTKSVLLTTKPLPSPTWSSVAHRRAGTFSRVHRSKG